jgi:hypothetical protein
MTITVDNYSTDSQYPPKRARPRVRRDDEAKGDRAPDEYVKIKHFMANLALRDREPRHQSDAPARPLWQKLRSCL